MVRMVACDEMNPGLGTSQVGRREDLQPPPTTITLGAIVDDPLGLLLSGEKGGRNEEDSRWRMSQKGKRSGGFEQEGLECARLS